MDFRLEFTPAPFDLKVNHRHHLMMIGSCFTEQMSAKLSRYKFSVLDNPNGILFNPVSIATAITSYIHNKQYDESALFYQNESWNSWDHHSRFSHPGKTECLAAINESRAAASTFLKKADWLMITLGSAFVYELEQQRVVANCHKVPTDKFNKRLLPADEIYRILHNMVAEAIAFNPGLRVIFTISPVRHIRDGFIENNRSKAALIQAVHQLVDENSACLYFPAYELVIDDLRDYRFYAEDMVHPNYAATNYVWEKFTEACIDQPSLQLMKEIGVVVAAKNHKPFNPGSGQHKKFLETNLHKVQDILKAHPYIDFSGEIDYFRSE